MISIVFMISIVLVLVLYNYQNVVRMYIYSTESLKM